MRNELNHIENIERYLSGDMRNGERQAFEMLIEGDPKLKAEVDLQAKLVQRLQLMSFKEEMVLLHDQLAASNGTSWWRIVLNSLLAIVGFCMTAIITALILTSLEDKPLTGPVSKIENGAAQDQTDAAQGQETDSLALLAAQPGLQEEAYVTDSHGANHDTNRNAAGNSTSRSEKGKQEVIDSTSNLVEVLDAPDMEIKTLHERFIKQFSIGLIDASAGGTVKTQDSESSIHIPPGILVHKNGLQATGTVEIRYREYRNPAEMVLSDIPMTYSENNIDYNFNSIGMIEVRAFQNGEELAVKNGKEFTIDYNVTEQLDSSYFFSLDDSSRRWTKLREILIPTVVESSFASDTGNGALRGQVFSTIDPGRTFKYDMELIPADRNGTKHSITTAIPEYEDDRDYHAEFIFADVVPGSYSLRYDTWFYLGDSRDRKREKGTIGNISIVPGQTVGLHLDLLNPPNRHLIMRKLGERRAIKMGEAIQPNYVLTLDTMPGLPANPTGVYFSPAMSGSDNNAMGATNISPNLVQGLECRAFGVYNCDQIKRVKPNVKVDAVFVDQNQQPLTKGYNLSMINLAYNASFGFKPQSFEFERDAGTILLLFTTDDNVYAMPASDFAAMGIQRNGTYTFVMTDITDRVKTSDQLKNYLGL
jgi:hypothetical protein